MVPVPVERWNQTDSTRVTTDPLTGHYYGRPPPLESLLLPAGALPPQRKYLDWHQEKVFAR